jgi:hypothetical protein
MRAKLAIFYENSASNDTRMRASGSLVVLEKLFEVLLVELEGLKMPFGCGLSNWLTVQAYRIL